WARASDIDIILDTHHEPLRQAMSAGVFLVKPNLRELRQLTQQKLAGEDEQRQALRRLVDDGAARYIVLSLGAGGAIFASAAGARHVRAPSVTIRSKVGAGDSMVGSLVWALTEGYTPLEATRFGVAAGAAAVQTAGSELCYAEDVHALYETIRAADSTSS
ncbi:MAG: bifunctional hydroxymethylpyrimidine kinase/phosphomethylpyrimidine kinase, partial [Anaerolineae bacterium]|nr:bifunctional hydroxymethylpyrimidine kinase/phosphomethylpyrimidine kinase [Anaerolineae bacterium]